MTAEIDDRVRIVKVPARLPHDDLQTKQLFEDCLHKIFQVAGFNEYGFIELHVGAVRQKPDYAETIWVEPEGVEILPD